MRLTFESYQHGYRIVSLVKSEEAARTLIDNELDFIWLDGNKVLLWPDCAILSSGTALLSELLQSEEYSVFEIYADGTVRKIYEESSTENYFYITGLCNSNCRICPTPEKFRKMVPNADISNFIAMARHIPSSASHLTITGGEPFMAGKNLFLFLNFLKEKFANTEFLLLTNGRILASNEYADLLAQTRPANFMAGIPVHGAREQTHDFITQSPGSFAQTWSGIKNMTDRNIPVEIRIVVCRQNVREIPELARRIISELPGIDHVSIMAAEMTGSARIHAKETWVPYTGSFEYLSEAVLLLMKHGIDVKLYNFPLCTVPAGFHLLVQKSISSHKSRFSKECEQCTLRNCCGGLFAGSYKFLERELKAFHAS